MVSRDLLKCAFPSTSSSPSPFARKLYHKCECIFRETGIKVDDEPGSYWGSDSVIHCIHLISADIDRIFA